MGGAPMAQDQAVPTGFCHFGNAALTPLRLLCPWLWLALGVLKKVAGDV